MSSLKKLVRKIIPEKIDYREQDARVNKTFKRRTVIVHHYCPHTFNAGDHFVIRSIRRNLKKYLPECQFVPRSIAHNRGWGAPFRLTGKNIAYSNLNADAVIVGGSDNYRNWSLRIKADEIPSLQPPLFLVGMGVSSNDLKQAPLIEKESYLRDIRAANHQAAVSTVRDNATYEFLHKLGIEKAVLTGCPALFIERDNEFHVSPEKPLLLTFPFPVNRTKMTERFKALLKLMQAIIARFGKENVIISCHDDRDVPESANLFPDCRLFYSNYADDYIPLYKDAAMVIGSRLHASILSASLGIPFLNINLDLRGTTFSETFELEEWNLDYNAEDMENKAIRRIEKVLSGDLSFFEKFKQKKDFLEKAFDVSMQQIADEIRSRVL